MRLPWHRTCRSSGSPILTGRVSSARLNEGCPWLLDPRCVLEQREERHGQWTTVEDAARLLGLAGPAVERVALTPLGIRVVKLVTADPDAVR